MDHDAREAWMKAFLQNGWTDVREWCQGRTWYLRTLLWIWFVYLLVRHLGNPDYQSLLGGLNLGIHEFGHLICSPLGQFVGIAGGSLVQCLIPVASFFMFYRQQDYFSFAFSLVWLGTNLFGISRYMADARKLQLPLVSPFGGEEVIHDWNYLLHELDLLVWDTTIASGVSLAAAACMFLGIAWGASVLGLMIANPRKEIRANWTTPDPDL